MSPATIAERIRLESQILNYCRNALGVALHAPIDDRTADEWSERVRFLTDSYRRHVSRLFRIKWETDDESALFAAEHPMLHEDLAALEADQRLLLTDLNAIASESQHLSASNLANLHAFRQRLKGFMERFEEARLRESKIWLDAFDIELGGEG